jgi:transposase-like protein
MANTIRDADREKNWRRNLTRHAKSGLTVRQFCRREKLHESAFYFWRRTIQQRDAMQHGSRQCGLNRREHDSRQCRPNRRGIKPPAFVPLVVDNRHPAASITLELRGGRALRLSESFSVERLAGLIRALEAEGQA